ncbi:predicted protein [Streptomyces viridosporus ATCC 14672]|uniref:Predicted protein n=1 Tax=Streptomyces viridosporus (strain ATCC 14672 / DSM 40746 / JCM 4963 / KCTC 9882 / NRRL B-12104 / FH 1290) TaxID=566461 RepID=D6A2Z6_STRV1|nr:predicted protein [Streptomyces viridosporus ATCC 14672]
MGSHRLTMCKVCCLGFRLIWESRRHIGWEFCREDGHWCRIFMDIHLQVAIAMPLALLCQRDHRWGSMCHVPVIVVKAERIT